MSGKNIGNQIEEQIKDTLREGLLTGNFSDLKSVIKNSAIEVIREATTTTSNNNSNGYPKTNSNGYPHTTGTKPNYYKYPYTGTNTNGKYTPPPTAYTHPHSTPDASKAYIQELQEKRKAREKELAAQQARERELRAQEQAKKEASKMLPVKFNPVGKISSPLWITGGAIGTVAFGSSAIGNLIELVIASSGLGGLIATGILTAGSIFAMTFGINQHTMLGKAKRYAQVCGNNSYSTISQLASAMGTKTKDVVKDIKKMLKKGFFPEGYLDDEETTLMLSDSVYKQYLETKNRSLQAMAQATANDLAENAIRSDNAMQARSKLTPEQVKELDSMVSEGHGYIDKLHGLNDIIPGEVISNKLDSLEDILKEIFEKVEEHPEQMGRMHKLMDYYLPTMIKLVAAYAEYDKIKSPGEDVIEAKNEIESTLDTINEAFVQLLNNLFTESVWDVTTDAQVLKTMLKKEGLTQ